MSIIVVVGDDDDTLQGVGCQYVTMSELKNNIRIGMAAPAAVADGTKTSYTDTEIYWAIRQVLEEIAPLVWIEDTVDIDFEAGLRDYDLPRNIEQILRVQRVGSSIDVLLPDNIVDIGKPVALDRWEHDRTATTNVLRFHDLRVGGVSIRVRYRYRMQIPPQPVALSTDMTASSSSIHVPDPICFPLPGYVKIDSELIGYSSIDVTTSMLTLAVRATNAAIHVAGANKVDPAFVLPTGRTIEQVVEKGAEYRLLSMRQHDGPSQDLQRILTITKSTYVEYQKAKKQLIDQATGTVAENLHPYQPRRRRYTY